MAKKKPIVNLSCPLYTEEELQEAMAISKKLDLGCEDLLRKALFDLIEREKDV